MALPTSLPGIPVGQSFPRGSSVVHFQASSAAEIATRKTPNDTKKKTKGKEKIERERGRNKTKRKKGKREKGWREEKIPLFRHDTASKRASARAIFFDQSSDERATSSLRCARVYNSPPLPQRITYVELWPGNAAGVALCLAFDNRSARRLRYRAEEWKDARFWNDGDCE